MDNTPILCKVDAIGFIKLLSFTDIFNLKLSSKYFANMLYFINADEFYNYIDKHNPFNINDANGNLYKNNYYDCIVMNSIEYITKPYATYSIIKPYNILHGLFTQYYKPLYIKSVATYYLGRPVGTHIKYNIGTILIGRANPNNMTISAISSPVYISKYEYGLRIYKLYISYVERKIKFTIYCPHKIKLYITITGQRELYYAPTKCKFNNIKLTFSQHREPKCYVRTGVMYGITQYKPIKNNVDNDNPDTGNEYCERMAYIHNYLINNILHNPTIIIHSHAFNSRIERIYSANGIKRKVCRKGMFDECMLSYYKNSKIRRYTYWDIGERRYFEKNSKKGGTLFNYIDHTIGPKKVNYSMKIVIY